MATNMNKNKLTFLVRISKKRYQEWNIINLLDVWDYIFDTPRKFSLNENIPNQFT